MSAFMKPNVFSRAMIMASLFIVIGSILAPVAPAQKYPIALGKKTPMSPRNQADYAALVYQYAKAACIDITNAPVSESKISGNVTGTASGDVTLPVTGTVTGPLTGTITKTEGGKTSTETVRIDDVRGDLTGNLDTRVSTRVHGTVSGTASGSNQPCEINVPEALRLRNALVFTALAQSDEVFRDYRTKRRRWSDGFELLMNFLEIGLTTATSITNGLRPKSVLADVTTLLQGTHRAVTKDLRLQENQVLFNVMETKRSTIYIEILGKLDKPDSAYSYPMALMDIMRYCKAGTLDEALAELSATTGIAKKTVEGKVIESNNAYFGSVPSKADLDLDAKTSKILTGLANQMVVTDPTVTAQTDARTAAIKSYQAIVDAIDANEDVLVAIQAIEPVNNALTAIRDELKVKDSPDIAKKFLIFRRVAFQNKNKEGFDGIFKKIKQIIVDNGNEKEEG
ncbi:MAG TPA: hypothetical protein VGO50_20275 [Pyrinomonadaceae bacterium]|jgi:hypothetical protein|nr:hypothetical protein [Pyrinomonadaceae bacterium]